MTTIDRVMRAALALALLAASACASGRPTRPASPGVTPEPITVHPSQIFEDVPQSP